jgi:hypothetical protein
LERLNPQTLLGMSLKSLKEHYMQIKSECNDKAYLMTVVSFIKMREREAQ